MGKVITISFCLAFLLLLVSASPVLAGICGVGPSQGASCCPQERCGGTTYGQEDCDQGELCCETCSQLVPTGNIGREFKLGGRSIVYVFPTLGSLISTILPNVYILAGLILFVLLLFGGFSFIMGAGGGNPEQANRGKQAIVAAVVGFGLIFASYWIVQIIQAVTGIDILNPSLPLAN
jgi:hypothetical protein